MMVYSCSLLPTKQVEVITKPLERTIVQPILPREIDLKEPYWLNFFIWGKNENMVCCHCYNLQHL